MWNTYLVLCNLQSARTSLCPSYTTRPDILLLCRQPPSVVLDTNTTYCTFLLLISSYTHKFIYSMMLFASAFAWYWIKSIHHITILKSELVQNLSNPKSSFASCWSPLWWGWCDIFSHPPRRYVSTKMVHQSSRPVSCDILWGSDSERFTLLEKVCPQVTQFVWSA